MKLSLSRNKVLLLSLLTAVVCIGLMSKSSPIYPFNNYDDANVFFTLGRCVKYGMVLYRDVSDAKGPLLFMLYALAACVSEQTWIGVWLLEVLCAWLTLYYAFRAAREVFPKAPLALIPATAALVYTSRTFSLGGGTAEEIMIPGVAYTFWLGLRCVLRGAYPSWRQSIVVGIAAAITFWSKYTLLMPHLACALVMLIFAYRQGTVRLFWKTIGGVFLAFALVSACVLCYFAAVGALDDLFDVYFYQTMFGYAHEVRHDIFFELWLRLAEGRAYVFQFAPVVLAVTVIGLWRLWAEGHRRACFYTAMCVVPTLGLSMLSGALHHYSFIIFFPLLPLLFCPVLSVAGLMPRMRLSSRAKFALCFAFSVAYIFVSSPKAFAPLRYPRESFTQGRFANIIAQTPDADVIVYGNTEFGVHNLAGILPKQKNYFASIFHHEEVMAVQDSLVRCGVVDYVMDLDLCPLDRSKAPLYEVVDSGLVSCSSVHIPRMSYLYRRKR